MSAKCSAGKRCDHGKFPDASMHCHVSSCHNSIYKCPEHRKGLR